MASLPPLNTSTATPSTLSPIYSPGTASSPGTPNTPGGSGRPSLKVTTSLSPTNNANVAQQQAAPATNNTRSYSHTRSQSMSEGGAGGASGAGGGQLATSSPPSSDGPPSTQGDLVRRHHTLSTSSSRLVRLERSRARLALQRVGLPESDQDFYLPPSPVGDHAAWSDLGHATTTTTSSSTAEPILSPGDTINASYVASPVTTTPWNNISNTSHDVGYGSAQHYATTTTPAAAVPVQTAPKRSSFVVVRGGKGDAALTERRAANPPPVAASTGTAGRVVGNSPPRMNGAGGGGAGGRTTTPPRQELKHKNSLKPFLEAEGETEEWERMQAETNAEESEWRNGVADDLYEQEPYASPPLGSAQFTTNAFSSHHSRANTYQPHNNRNSDPWGGISNPADEGAAIRRHQSLNSFRTERSSHPASERLSTSSSTDGWGSPHAHSNEEQQILGSLSLSSVGFGRSRSGTTPAPLNLPNNGSTTSLSHSNSLKSSHGHSSLSHSNSLNSHDRGALSPVGGFPRSPWSPTLEETKQLGMGSAVGTPPAVSNLSRGGSGSSRGSAAGAGGVGGGGRFAEEVAGRLAEDFTHVDLNGTGDFSKPPSPPRMVNGMVSTKDQQQQPIGRSLSGNGPPPARRLPPLMTNLESVAQGQQPLNNVAAHNAAFLSRQGPASAAAFVPPIGHSHLPNPNNAPLPPPSSNINSNNASQRTAQPDDYLPNLPDPNTAIPPSSSQAQSRGNFTALPGGTSSSEWHRQKELLVGGGANNNPGAFPSAVGVPSGGGAEANWPAGGGFGVGLAMQQQAQISALQRQMQEAMAAMNAMRAQGVSLPPVSSNGGYATTAGGFVQGGGSQQTLGGGGGGGGGGAVDSPIDLPSLIANKGYNPPSFDLRPTNARFFVIKSYTEEDVHKSLKHEIWASTDLGNKRLDRAFRESADKGPIYLFFSVNASGHFAGMAQMITPVDYSMSSNVWASDKWKGVLKVRWIYIKDVPLAALRHIRLSNTPENKPVTSSRDTQEVPYDAGLEVLRILSSYQSRTSLLQDLPWYEARNAAAAAGGIVEGEEVEKRQHYARPTPSPAPQQQQQQQQQQHYATRPIPQNMYQQSLPPQAYGITSTPPPFMPVAAPLGANGGGRRYFGMGPVQGGTTGGGPGAVF